MRSASSSPVSGSISVIRSTSSPKNSTRTMRSSDAGWISSVSPRTRNRARGSGLVVALVLEVDEVAQDGVAAVLAAGPQAEHGRAVVDRRAEAVDAADTERR